MPTVPDKVSDEGWSVMGNIGAAFVYGCLLGFVCGLVFAKLSPWPI